MILGIDEVGRGPYAGPLVVGACILPNLTKEAEKPGSSGWILELTDSKKLTAKRRDLLYDKIKAGALASATGWVTSFEIDEIGISEGLKLACRRAVKKIKATKVPFSEIIIDGTINFLAGTSLEKYTSTLKKGDLLVKEISAASIVAKVERDRYMMELAKKYPEYGFERHVGYGTKFHQEAMEKFGLTPEHRRSFRPVREIWEKAEKCSPEAGNCGETRRCFSEASNWKETGEDSSKTSECSKALGNQGEEAVVDFLRARGHEIVSRNFKTKQCEIDVISLKEQMIIFTEVKYRRTNNFGEPLEFIDAKKQERMLFAAENFLHLNPEYEKFLPRMAVAGVGKDFRVQDWVVVDDLYSRG